MALTILDPTVAAAVAAATTQEAQCAALAAPWAGGDVTVRCMASGVLRDTVTYGPWEFDGATPRGMTLGPLLARSVASTGGLTTFVFRAGTVDVFSMTAAVGSGADVAMAAAISTAARTNLSDGLLSKTRISANPTLPVASAVATAFTLSMPAAGTTGTPVTVTVTPNGPIPSGGASVTLAASNGGVLGATSLSFTSGATAAQTTTLTRSTDGTSTVTMTNSAGLANTGGPATYTSYASPVTLGFDAQTPEQISLYCPTLRAVASGTTVAVRYRVSGGTWRTGHPLLHIEPGEVTSGAPIAVVDAFAGAIFDLSPGVTYDIELTVSEPGQADVVVTGTRATRSLPAAAGTPNKTLTTAGNLQATLNGLVAGDVLQLAAGTYTVSNLTLSNSGSAGALIYIRGASKTGVIIKDTTNEVLTIAAGVSHVVIENLTIEGSSTDSGTASTSAGIVFSDSAGVQTNITLRSLNFVGVDRGIKAYTRVDGALVYGCDLTGNNTWDKTYIDNGGLPNLTWNDDGICLPGLGNAAWNNTLRGFGDAFATYGSYSLGLPAMTQSAAVYFYRNLIEYTGDDACEGDYSTRNCGFYDNYIGSGATLLSLDPVWGGPFWCFRNTAVQLVRGPLKLTDQNSGALVYNNTVLKGTVPQIGGAEYGWYGSNNGVQAGMSFRNNLLVKRGAGTDMRLEFDVSRIDFHHNAWYPNNGFNWTNAGGNFGSAALAEAGLPSLTTLFGVQQRHAGDVAVTSNPWVAAVTLPADYTTQYTARDRLTLASGSAAKAAGVAIPGITDGYSGAAPDIGAEIAGRAAVVFGTAGLTGADAWISPQPVNTWGIVPGSITLGDVDPDNNPAYNPNYPAAAPWRQTFGGFQGITNAWCGAAFDASTGTYWWTAIGGHNDKYSNEIIKLELDSAAPAFAMVLPPSGSVGQPSITYPEPGIVNTGVYSDGRPRAFHSYGSPVYWPGVGPAVSQMNALAPSGGLADLAYRGPWFFDETTGAATKGAAPPNVHLGNGSASCYDPSRNVVWDMSNANNRQMAYYSRTSNTWTLVGTPRTFSGTVSLCYLPGFDCILVGNGETAGGTNYQSEAGGWLVFDCAAGTWHTPTFTGAPGLGVANPNGVWPGMCQPQWAASLGAALTWDNASNTTQIMKLTPGANPRTDAWTISMLTVDAANTVTPGVRRDAGTWGRFAVWDDKRVCILVGTISEPVKFFKYG